MKITVIFVQLIYSMLSIEKTDKKKMELRQLKYFIKAAELQNFTEAAKKLFITQSTLSQQIKQIEDELGILLFERTGKRLFITEAGLEFLPFAKQTVENAQKGIQRIRDLQGIKTGTLKIGITYSLSFGLSNIIQQFLKKYPDIHLEVVNNTAHDLQQMLVQHEIDFALSLKLPNMNPNIEMTTLFEVPLCAVVNDIHPFANATKISVKEVAKQTVILPSKGLSARSCIDDIMEESGTYIKPHLEINDVNILLQIIENSPYVTILAQTTIERRKKLRAIPIIEQKKNLTAALLTLKGEYQKAAAKAFMEIYKEEFFLHSIVN